MPQSSALNRTKYVTDYDVNWCHLVQPTDLYLHCVFLRVTYCNTVLRDGGMLVMNDKNFANLYRARSHVCADNTSHEIVVGKIPRDGYKPKRMLRDLFKSWEILLLITNDKLRELLSFICMPK